MTMAAQVYLRKGLEESAIRERLQQERDGMCDSLRFYAEDIRRIGAEMDSEQLIKAAGRIEKEVERNIKARS